jgi:S1-C subfamily serine protease
LGISGTTLTADLAATLKLSANQKGIVVVDVTANSPAAKAGLLGGTDAQGNPSGSDIIVAVDSQAVNRFEDLVSYLFNHTDPGQTLKLTILRGGSEQTLQVVLDSQPAA